MAAKWKRALAAAAGAAALAGCGGGGGDAGVGVGVGLGIGGGSVNVVDVQADEVLFAVNAFDSLAGIERLLALSNGYAVLEGLAGVDTTVACPAGGTLRTRKPDAATFVLAPLNCRLRADDPLFYSGAWSFTLTGNTFPAGGCPAAGTCRIDARVDSSLARFGYGSVQARAVGSTFTSTTVAGTRTTSVAAANETWTTPPGAQVTVNGTLANLAATVGQVTYRISGDAARQTIGITEPLRATVTLGTAITASIDNTGDGIADRTLTLPWSLLPF
jgi:hypothetical protein